MVAETSKESYKQMIDELGQRQREIYELVKEHPDSTYNDLIRITGKRTNTLTARLNELVNQKAIVVSGFADDPVTGKTNRTYHVSEGYTGPSYNVGLKRIDGIDHELVGALLAYINGDFDEDIFGFVNGFHGPISGSTSLYYCHEEEGDSARYMSIIYDSQKLSFHMDMTRITDVRISLRQKTVIIDNVCSSLELNIL